MILARHPEYHVLDDDFCTPCLYPKCTFGATMAQFSGLQELA
jgi:hypothetical protein